jgi:hypothetical protein
MTEGRRMARIVALVVAGLALAAINAVAPDGQVDAASSLAVMQVRPTLMPAPGAGDEPVLYPPVYYVTPMPPDQAEIFNAARATMIAPAVRPLAAPAPAVRPPSAGTDLIPPALPPGATQLPVVEVLVSEPPAGQPAPVVVQPAVAPGRAPGVEIVVTDPSAGQTVVVLPEVNCSDFPSQAAAQAALREFPSDPFGLDRDRDGIACESNPAPRDTRRVPR